MSTGTSGLASKIIEGAGKLYEMPEYTDLASGLQMHIAEGKATEQAIKGFAGLAGAVQKRIKEEEEKKKQEELAQMQQWNELSNKVLDSDYGYSDDEYKELYSDLEKEKLEFIDADNQEKAILLNNLEKRNDSINAYKDFKTELALSANNPDGIQNNQMFLTSQLGQSYKGIFDGSTPMTKNEKGEYGAMIYNPKLQEERRRELQEINNTIDLANVANDGSSILDLDKRRKELEDEIYAANMNPSLDVSWTSTDAMNREIKNQSFDRVTNDLITEAASSQWNMGSKTPQGSGKSFDYDRTYDVVKSQIIGAENSNMRSLIYDKHLDESFYNTIVKEISGLTDQDLGLQNYGISSEVVASLDPGTDGDPTKIMPQDAEIIARAISESQDIEDYLATYFTKHIEKNYISGYNSRPVPSNVSNLNEYA